MKKLSSVDSLIDLCFELHRAMRHRLSKANNPEDQSLTLGQIHALFQIERKAGLTMKELADALRVTSPSATSFVNRLERLKWVERYHDPENRRLVRLRLTTKGGHLIHGKMDQHKEGMRTLLALLSSSDQQSLARILKHVLKALSSPPRL